MNKDLKSKPRRGCLPIIAGAFGIFISVIYLLNMSAGFVEIPDNLPIVGNLDEVFFTAILISSLSIFGIRLPMASGKRIEEIQTPPKEDGHK